MPKGALTLFPLEVCGGANKRRFVWASAEMGTDPSVRSIVMLEITWFHLPNSLGKLKIQAHIVAWYAAA